MPYLFGTPFLTFCQSSKEFHPKINELRSFKVDTSLGPDLKEKQLVIGYVTFVIRVQLVQLSQNSIVKNGDYPKNEGFRIIT